jgi:hypothetical protein
MNLDGRLFSKLSLALCLFEEGFIADVFGLFIPLPLKSREVHTDEIMESWGFSVSFADRCIHFNWAHHTRIWEFPWAFKHYSTHVRDAAGSWNHKRCDAVEDLRYEQTFPYVYVLESGERQERTATVYVERMEWRWRWFPHPITAKVSVTIDVTFNEEIGERVGTYKGGTVGCDWEMLPGESMGEAVARMEAERKFD